MGGDTSRNSIFHRSISCRVRRLVFWLIALSTSCTTQVQPSPPPPTIIVVTSVGPFQETFDQVGEWLVGESAISSGGVENGAFVLNVKQSQQLAWTHIQREFADGIYEVDARMRRGPEASGFGMIFLASENAKDFLYFEVTGDGRYDIGYCEDWCSVQASLIDGYKLGYTILPAGEINHLRVEINNGSLFFQVNGAPISELHRIEYQPGTIGLLAESSPRGGFEVVFDNFQVAEFPTPEEPPQ